MKKIFCLLLLFNVMISIFADDLKLDKATLHDLALQHLNYNENIKNIYITGTYTQELKTFETENYPKIDAKFEYYQDGKVEYLQLGKQVSISDYRNTYAKLKNNSYVQFQYDYLNSNLFCSVIQAIRMMNFYTFEKINTTPNNIILSFSNPPHETIYTFKPNYQLEKIVRYKNSKIEFLDYKQYHGLYFPSKVLRTFNSPFSKQISTFKIETLEVNIPTKHYEIPKEFTTPEKVFAPQITIGDWQRYSLMSRNLKAMQEIYGDDLTFHLHVSFINVKNSKICKLIQLNFKDEAAALKSFEKLKIDKNIVALWQYKNHVYMFESALTPETEELIDMLKKDKVVFDF